MTITTPTCESVEYEVVEVGNRQSELKPIPLSPIARERLKVLNEALKTTGPDEMKIGDLVADVSDDTYEAN